MSDVRAAVAEKLSPSALKVSPKFGALLAYLLDETWTSPAIIELAVTVDGMLNVWTSDGDNAIQGHVDDLLRNIRGAAEVAELTPAETDWLISQVPAPGTSGRVKGALAAQE